MILKISVNKARYEKGQIFPFLIAIIAVIIIIAMITLNLGQIAIFKTDVSNAADAAALAGASTLSGYLLGIGLQSDMMCGEMLVAVAAILIEVITVIGIPIAIATYIAYLVRMLVTYFQALEEGKMAWSNAKKTAMQYAFQNAGIDEQRPSFKEFLKGVYDVSDPYNLPKADTAAYYNIYSLGDDINASTDTRKKIKKYSQGGFSRFMEEGGYWDESVFGPITPGNISPAIVTTGYGWDPLHGTNSYDSRDSYSSYPNSVEVQVIANVMYPLKLYNPLNSEVQQEIDGWITNNIEDALPWWLRWLAQVAVWLINLVLGLLGALMPGGFKFSNAEEDNTIKDNTDDNPISVTVRRYKEDKNLGLWKFRYGAAGVIEASATAHVYRENGDEDIRPVVWGGLWDWISAVFTNSNWQEKWTQIFKTQKHLFETELTGVR